jgi:hypothetical protein
VLVEHDGHWLPGTQREWRLGDDGRGWRADVEFVAEHDWDAGKYMPAVPPERLRPSGGFRG